MMAIYVTHRSIYVLFAFCKGRVAMLVPFRAALTPARTSWSYVGQLIIKMLDTNTHPGASHAAAAAAALDAALSGQGARPSALLVAVRKLEAQLCILLASAHEDAIFWPSFSALMLELDADLSHSECRRLRAHADFLLVRAGRSSQALNVVDAAAVL
ncbi:hypothetical protein [Xanthomonas albilineans]|nr:hypothetical protein [Xanthomonas albilineans]